MLARPLLNRIVANEALTRGLSDPEARMLVEWVVDRAERRAAEADTAGMIQRLLRRARAIGRFVTLWCYNRERGAACQLAASERFTWPLPNLPQIDPCELMHAILLAEEGEVSAAA